MSRDPTPREMGHYVALAQIGMEMVLPAVLGVYLDQWFETIPWITIALGVLGFAIGLYHLVTILNRQDGDRSSDRKTPP
jgi:ATP synthase protein I